MIQARVVKRYSNRKLYDTAARRYVTRPMVAELIAAGVTVQIIDQVTGGDITERTMARPARRSVATAPMVTSTTSGANARSERIVLELPRQLVGRAVAVLTAPAAAELKRRWGGDQTRVIGLQRQVDDLTAQVKRLRAELADLRNPSHAAVP